MMQLIRAEFYKLFKSPAYGVMLALSVGVGVFFAVFWISRGTSAGGYQMLPVMDSFVLFHSIFACAFTAVFLCGEFSGRTMGMGLLCGLLRSRVFSAKLIVYFVGLLFLLTTVVMTPMAIMTYANGFGMELTVQSCMEVLEQMLFFWLVSSALGGCAIFLAMATKNAIATIGAGIGLVYLLLMMTSNYINSGVESYYPAKYTVVYQMFVLADWEHLQKGLFLGVSLVTLILTLAASVLLFEKAELK